MHRLLASTLCAAALAASQSACPPCDTGRPDLFYDGLQSACEGLPCGWTVEAGDVASVYTYHEAERGLRLAQGAVASRPLPAVALPEADPDGPVLTLLAACAPEAELVVEVELELSAPEGTSAAPERVLLVGRLAADPARLASGPLLSVDVPLTAEDGAPAPAGRAVLLRVGVEGAGACTLDDLHLVHPEHYDCFG